MTLAFNCLSPVQSTCKRPTTGAFCFNIEEALVRFYITVDKTPEDLHVITIIKIFASCGVFGECSWGLACPKVRLSPGDSGSVEM